MNREFIPYEQSIELIELGFDESCLAFYNGRFLEPTNYDFDDCSTKDIGRCYVAPLYQQAFRWFRKKHELSSWIYNSDASKSFYRYFYTILFNDRFVKAHESADTYEDAELACLKKLIQIVKNK